MELNLAPVSKSFVAKPPSKEKRKVKGSWKKRRREQVIQRLEQKRKQNGGIRQPQKAKTRQIQVDEFSSGIEKTASASPVEKPSVDEEPEPKRRKRGMEKDSAEKDSEELTPNGSIENVKSKNLLNGKVSKRPRAVITSGTKKKGAASEFDKTPEAVRATLAIVGNEPAVKSAEEEGDDGDGESSPIVTEPSNEEKSSFSAVSFEETGLYQSITHHLVKRMAIQVPTKIQELVLKTMLNLGEGQLAIDLLVRSATGSGKTLAYLLPIAHFLLNRTRRITREEGAFALVIVPTRELADQVHEVAQLLFRPWHWIVVGCVIGGESKRREKARIRKGINLLVATPGRLLDHMRNTQSFLYGFCEFLVLDEADRLLDLGFEADVKELVSNLDKQAMVSNPDSGKTRSNILLSATLSKDVKRLAEFSLQDPVELAAKSGDGDSNKNFAMPEALKQHFCIVEQKYRLVTLACFLRLRAVKDALEDHEAEEEPTCKIIVFFSTCDSVDFHYNLLRQVRLPSELRPRNAPRDKAENLLPLDIFRIHGNHTQSDRMSALRSFRKSRRGVLLCTDVAARGLDLKGLSFAIQYDPPTGGQGEELEYLHRAGRTARLGARGDALLFLLPSEKAYVDKLGSAGITISEISGSAALAALYPKADLSNEASISYATRLVTSAVQDAFETVVNENEELKREAVAGYQSYCRAYATHAKEVKYFFHVRNLHLGHVARAFVLSDKPVVFSETMAEINKEKAAMEAFERQHAGREKSMGSRKADIARARAEGDRQPFNNQLSALARRRREKGKGQEAMREMAMEFGS